MVLGLLIASLIGILLDKYTSVPWKATATPWVATTFAGNTHWMAGEADRIAGFARVSTSWPP